jgi:predicted alpha/beta hydrolase family esterase
VTIHTTLILPGWQNSGPAHWQSLWETAYGYQRVEQHDWDRPLRGDWITRLEDVVLSQPADQPITLVAHSLGCLLVAAWAGISRNTHRVSGALLVAPGDVEQEALRPVLTSWSPILPAGVPQTLPFKSLLLGSQNDPYCSLARARQFAEAWGSTFIDYGMHGHINSESGLKSWPEGHSLLLKLQQVPLPNLPNLPPAGQG